MEEKNNATEKVEDLVSRRNNDGVITTVLANDISEKAEKENDKDMRSLEMERSRELRAQKKRERKIQLQKARAERDKRKKMLKNENALEKAKRLSIEKEERRRKRKEDVERREKARAEKLEKRREKTERKKAEKSSSGGNKNRSKGIGGWLATVISLSCAVLVLGALLTYNLVSDMGGKDMFENTMERSFYDLVGYVDNIDVNMTKMLVSNDKSEQQRLLGDITTQATLASDKLGELPLQDESKYYTTKFVNQVADFSKYLNHKLIDGEKISQADYETLEKVEEINRNLKAELDTLSASLGEDFKFTSLMDDNKENVLLDSFSSLEKGSVDYPSLIYDGPFSDNKEPKAVKTKLGEEVSAVESIDIFKSIFKDYNFETVEVTCEIPSPIPCYQIEAKSSKQDIIARVSKEGGKLLAFDCYKECSVSNVNIEQATEIAQNFLQELDLKNMKAVWGTDSQAVDYLNFCYEDSGVIIYPDMIKVNVCGERGVVSSFDATEYYLNHTERQIATPKLSKSQAITQLSQNIKVESTRLCQIPYKSQERLAYEISGTYGGETYFIYVDANSGKELNIFKVVDNLEGKLVI